MWARAGLLAMGMAMLGCYAPSAVPGAPCMPALNNCPGEQRCTVVEGEFVCTEGLVVDASSEGVLGDSSDDVDGATAQRWTLVDSSGSIGDSTQVASTAAGHSIIVAVETSAGSPVTSVTDDASNAYVPVVGSRAKNTEKNLGVELWYAKDASAGAGTITATAGTTIRAVVAWEVAGLDSTNPLAAASKLDDQPSSTTPAGASITTTSAGEFVVSVVIVASSVAGIQAGNAFTNDDRTLGNGWAHLTDRDAPVGTYEARWDQQQGGSMSCASSAAFRVGP